MSIYTFKLELRLDTTEEGKEAVAEIVRQHALSLKVSTMLINDQRYTPQVAVTCEDAFYTVEDVDLSFTTEA